MYRHRATAIRTIAREKTLARWRATIPRALAPTGGAPPIGGRVEHDWATKGDGLSTVRLSVPGLDPVLAA